MLFDRPYDSLADGAHSYSGIRDGAEDTTRTQDASNLAKHGFDIIEEHERHMAENTVERRGAKWKRLSSSLCEVDPWRPLTSDGEFRECEINAKNVAYAR
jgi:hypothetical protein